MMLCGTVLSRKKDSEKVSVYLNVYDLTLMNGYAYWFGLGVYHSDVQVHGVEYAFGAHDRAITGIFEVEPKQRPGFTFRKSILIGRTNLGAFEVRSCIHGEISRRVLWKHLSSHHKELQPLLS